MQLCEVLAFCPKDGLLLSSHDFLLYGLLVIFVTLMMEENPI